MRKLRRATKKDDSAIEILRNVHGSVAPRLPEVDYSVVDHNGTITTCFGLKFDGPTRALVVDFYGSDARDWEFAFDRLCEAADKNGVELSGWCLINNKNTKYFERRGFKETMRLFRRQPVKKVK
ncbi:MAG: hypothetical protein KGL39_43910 [Patescibacteria group bacterium]|nr:hypothetical protein [Patescibacteria group bacterium]